SELSFTPVRRSSKHDAAAAPNLPNIRESASKTATIAPLECASTLAQRARRAKRAGEAAPRLAFGPGVRKAGALKYEGRWG
ncbi:MAG TPA: hypothetical protein VNR65_14995, partial [Geobacterales bacterium]|nr:hypothetical protein [Geobacterales bacterium]